MRLAHSVQAKAVEPGRTRKCSWEVSLCRASRERIHVRLHHAIHAACACGGHQLVDGASAPASAIAQCFDGDVEPNRTPMLEAVSDVRAGVVIRTATPSTSRQLAPTYISTEFPTSGSVAFRRVEQGSDAPNGTGRFCVHLHLSVCETWTRSRTGVVREPARVSARIR